MPARFREKIGRILEHPGTGSPRPKLGNSTRIAIVYPYLMIFDHVRGSGELTLLRVLHGRRKITKRLIRARGPA